MFTSPTSSYCLYAFSIADYNPSIWFDPNQTHTYLASRSPITRDTLAWDMQSLAETYFGQQSGNYRTLDPTDSNWYPIFVSTATDSGGTFIEPLPLPYAVPAFTRVNPAGLEYGLSIESHPMVPALGVTSVVAPSEAILMEACCIPGSPFLFGSNIPGHPLFGPLFFEEISFSVSGQGELGPVSIKSRLKGGRSIVTPDLSSRQDDFSENAGYAGGYRSATLADCGFVYDAVFDPTQLLAGMALGSYWGISELVSMSLHITQNIKLDVTANPDGRTDLQGPRFATIGSRTVKGELQFYSSQNTSPFATADGFVSNPVTMYFGNQFLFVMENVDFQRPTIQAAGGKGYVHTLSFVARAAPGSITRRLSDSQAPLSEFSYVGY